MEIITTDVICSYVNDHIGEFHQSRIESLSNLKLLDILKRKNPYLFKAKNVLTSDEIIRGIVDAHISSSEEGIFGDWLENLAIFINGRVFGGKKSGINGIDLEFDKENIRYIVSIKSGPNWANNSQLQKMREDFKSARIRLRTSGSKLEIVAVNGCCYGKDNKPDKGDYFKYCGQHFWFFISGDENLYTEIIEPLGFKAKTRNDDYQREYAKKINLFTSAFTAEFCGPDGEIDWLKLVSFNSGMKK